jgi:3-deoxy-D-arabino-heptulosonate 7-phosphate (DAHP) synthase
MVEVHPSPDDALSDGPQQLRSDDFDAFAAELRELAALMGKVFG